jgi:hypothetical protein
VGFYMIACKVSSVYRIILPPYVRVLLEHINAVITLGLEHLLTPLDCLGLHGYIVKLYVWLALYPAGYALLLMGTVLVVKCVSGTRFGWWAFGECAVRLAVQLLFLFYPIISTIAFEAMACYEFPGEDERPLVVDVSIDCSSDNEVISDSANIFGLGRLTLGWAAVSLYACGAILGVVLLLSSVKNEIWTSARAARPPVHWRARGLRFLYVEYKPDFYFWGFACSDSNAASGGPF